MLSPKLDRNTAFHPKNMFVWSNQNSIRRYLRKLKTTYSLERKRDRLAPQVEVYLFIGGFYGD